MIALIHKELREHGFAVMLMAALAMGLFVLLLIISAVNPNRGSFLLVLRGFMILGFPFCAFFLGHRLVSREYTGKTQFFLEALPVSRSSVFFTKWLLGLVLLMGLTLLGLGGVLVPVLAYEFFSLKFLGIVLVRLAGYVFFVHAFAFACSFLGRYRIAGLIAAVIAMTIISAQTSMNLIDQGPLSLVYNEKFAFERELYPMMDFYSAMGSGLVFWLIGLLMVLLREGSVAAMLAERMSSREKIFIACVFVGLLLTLATLEEREDPVPFELVDGLTSQGEAVQVTASRSDQLSEAETLELVERLRVELEAMRDYLGLPVLAPVFLTIRQDLDAGVYEQAELASRQGVMIRLSYSDEFDEKHFLSWMIPKVLAESTFERVLLEQNRWLLDGFAHFFPYRDLEGKERGRLLMRAAFGAPDQLTRDHLDQWLLFREEVGADIASAVAWFGLVHLEERIGVAGIQALLVEKLGANLPHDFQASWREWREPLGKVVKDISDISYDDLIDSWGTALREEKIRLRALSELTALDGVLGVETLSEKTRRISYQLKNAEAFGDRRVRFRYVKLAFYQTEFDETDIQSEDLPASKLKDPQVLPGTWSRGSRIAYTFSIQAPELGCEIISGWRRMELR